MKSLKIVALTTLLISGLSAKNIDLVNISYDPTRGLYKEYNDAFAKYYKSKTGDTVRVKQSNGGSASQARSIIDGLEADIVTLGLEYDINAIASRSGAIVSDWRSKFPHNSAPYTTTIIFLVKKGNPKNVKDWSDLVRDDVKSITSNPKTSSSARWAYLGAWAYAQNSYGSQDKAREFVTKLYANIPILDAGARGATNTFIQRGIGDVLITSENEAYLALNELGRGRFEIVVPSYSVLVEPSVALVDKVVDKRGTREVATEYLNHLYSKEGQRIIAKHYYRPIDSEVAKEYEKNYSKLQLTTVDEAFGGWQKAQEVHFNDGGEFDKFYSKIKR